MPSDEEMKAELERLRIENEALETPGLGSESNHRPWPEARVVLNLCQAAFVSS